MGVGRIIRYEMTRNLEFINGMGILKNCDLSTTGDVCIISPRCSLKVSTSGNKPEILDMFIQFIGDILKENF